MSTHRRLAQVERLARALAEKLRSRCAVCGRPKGVRSALLWDEEERGGPWPGAGVCDACGLPVAPGGEPLGRVVGGKCVYKVVRLGPR